MSGLSKSFIDLKIQTRRIMVFAKSNDPDSIKVKEILDQYYLPQDSYEWINIEKRQDCRQLENYLQLLSYSDRRQTPYIFIDQLYFGSLFELNICHENRTLKTILVETENP